MQQNFEETLKNENWALQNQNREVLEQYQLWESNKFIICNTTSVNTGVKNGVVVMI